MAEQMLKPEEVSPVLCLKFEGRPRRIYYIKEREDKHDRYDVLRIVGGNCEQQLWGWQRVREKVSAADDMKWVDRRKFERLKRSML